MRYCKERTVKRQRCRPLLRPRSTREGGEKWKHESPNPHTLLRFGNLHLPFTGPGNTPTEKTPKKKKKTNKITKFPSLASTLKNRGNDRRSTEKNAKLLRKRPFLYFFFGAFSVIFPYPLTRDYYENNSLRIIFRNF